MCVKYRILITGMVQGIGFRPFVAELAERLQLVGQVKNLGGIVEVFVSGEKQAVDDFIAHLRLVDKNGELPGCRIDAIQITELSENAFAVKQKEKFLIVESEAREKQRRFLPVDMPICDRCAAEMHEATNRRYRYPFISCTACGPRFSIQKAVPYDRKTITMDDFCMCQNCQQEYTEKGNIRRHAQTIACRTCGPKLWYAASGKEQVTEEQQAIAQAVCDLKSGKIGAIKDIGGYHFACSPLLREPVKRLRNFKNRDKKPFAVMFLNMESIKEYCEVSKKEEEILLSAPRPIVLLKKKKDFVSEVCGQSDYIGAFLPCNPLQILLLEETGPLVMTSGNRGGEPMLISEEDMLAYIGNGIDFMLTHDREILTPLDDSIYQVVEISVDVPKVQKTYSQCIRRARGIVPEPISLPRKLNKETFAAGGDLKAVFALGREELVYLSPYFGDLEDIRCMESRQKSRQRMEKLLDISPKITVGDLHPAYLSAQGMDIKIQHHHAHAASVIAEHGLKGKVLGIICDGTGFGTDGTIWGSEFLLCEEERMERKGNLLPVKLMGGDLGAKQADMTLFSYMLSAQERQLEGNAFFEAWEKHCQEKDGQAVLLQKLAWKQNINTVYSSSMGRLFDAAAAALDICCLNSYEGECAILLEQMAHKGKKDLQAGKITVCNLQMDCLKADKRWQLDGTKLLLDLYRLKAVYSKEILAYLFHHAIAEGILQTALHICEECQVQQIVLSGGSFINRILLEEVMRGLLEKGKRVYINEKVPCGDGGIALGQMYLSCFLPKYPVS